MALVISILVLFVLTVLGLALMLTTAIESEVAVNHRWSEMAFYNAEAGLEFGKNVLAGYSRRDGDFRNALPLPRTNLTQPPPPNGTNRDDQFWMLQNGVVVSVGRVLVDPNPPGGAGSRRLEFDFRNPRAGDVRGDLDGDRQTDVQGTVTIWVRRDVVLGPAGAWQDDANASRVILTAEGTAPNYEGFAGRNVAMRRLEMTLSLPSAGGPVSRTLAQAAPTAQSDTRSAGPTDFTSTDIP